MSINITSLSLEELISLNADVVALIKSRRKMEAKAMGMSLSVGDRVWVNERNKRSQGIVRKIMRTRAIVLIDGMRYKVPMSMLSFRIAGE